MGTSVAWLGGLASRVQSLVVLRWIVVGSQAATILVSWPLWQSRTEPPLLPALPMPSIDMGWPLLGSLVLALASPPAGALVHGGVLALATAMDQTRLQPEVVSMALLLVGCAGPPALVLVARIHVLTVWFWAGLTKLLSPDFFADMGPWLFEGLPLPAALDGAGGYFGAVVVVLELGAGVLGVPVRTRVVAAAFAVAVHIGALLSLGPLGRSWNPAIWAWNVALAAAAVALIAPWRHGLRAELAGSRWPLRLVAAFLALYPLGFYFGAADAYLSHHLYSADTPTAVVCEGRGRCSGDVVLSTLDSLKVPLPPEHRVLRSFFDRTCEPDEVMLITDDRWWYSGRDWQPIRRCPAPRPD